MLEPAQGKNNFFSFYFLFGHIINNLLTELGRSVWENLDLSLRAGSHFRCYKRCGTSGEAASYESARGVAREMPDLSPARCARRLVTRGFAARATSFITTKMRACSQAILTSIAGTDLTAFGLATSVKILPYRSPARLIRTKLQIKLRLVIHV